MNKEDKIVDIMTAEDIKEWGEKYKSLHQLAI